jgi:hypothetical protein
MSPRNRVVQSYPQAPVSLFVPFSDSLGYGAGVVVCDVPVLFKTFVKIA